MDKKRATNKELVEALKDLLFKTKLKEEHKRILDGKLDILLNSESAPERFEYEKTYFKGFLSAMFILCREFTTRDFEEMREILG